MSAVRAPKQPPTYYADVEVSIDPWDLEAAGWVFVGRDGDGDAAMPDIDRLLILVRQMHDAEHEGPMRWCQHDVCKGVERDGVGSDV